MIRRVTSDLLGWLLPSDLPFRAVRFVSRVTYTTSAYIFAQEGTDGGAADVGFDFDPSTILNTGIVGIALFAFFTDRVFTAKAYNRVIAERDKAEAARDELTKQQFDQVLPLLGSLKEVLVPLMQRVSDKLDHIDAPKDTG